METRIKGIDSPEIQELMRKRPNYGLQQMNGQRYYGPPIDNSLEPPQEGSEVYVTNIPFDCFEDELVPIFESIATIYQLRLMMNFSGLTRGYAYVKYTNPSDARIAARTLQKLWIRDGVQIYAVLSNDNRRLKIYNLPEGLHQSALVQHLVTATEGVKSVAVGADGSAVVRYETHHLAAMARRVFAKGFKINDQQILFDWFDPRPDHKSVSILIYAIIVFNI